MKTKKRILFLAIFMLLVILISIIIIFAGMISSFDSNFDKNELNGIDSDQNISNTIEKIILPIGDIPKSIIDSSNTFIDSLNETNNNLALRKALVLENDDSKEYSLIYSFQIIYLRENGKESRSIYSLEIRLDKSGNIINKETVKERYNFLVSRGI